MPPKIAHNQHKEIRIILTSELPLSAVVVVAVVVVVVEAEVEPPPDGRLFLGSTFTKAIENTTQKINTFGSILDVSKETSKARMSLYQIHILYK